MKKPAIFLAFAMLAIAPAAMAKTHNISGSITGTFDAGSVGPCATGYANQCASGTCFHFQPATGTTPTGSGTIGKGTVTSMCVTVDAGNNVNAPADTDTKHTTIRILRRPARSRLVLALTEPTRLTRLQPDGAR